MSRVEYAFDNQPATVEEGVRRRMHASLCMCGGEPQQAVGGACVCVDVTRQRPNNQSQQTHKNNQQSPAAPLPPSFLRTAILHFGADALLRECYCPAKFPHRVGVFECVLFFFDIVCFVFGGLNGSIGYGTKAPPFS